MLTARCAVGDDSTEPGEEVNTKPQRRANDPVEHQIDAPAIIALVDRIGKVELRVIYTMVCREVSRSASFRSVLAVAKISAPSSRASWIAALPTPSAAA